MNTSLRHTATWMLLAIGSCAAPAFAQKAAPEPAPAATAVNAYGVNAQLPANRRAAHRDSEKALLGSPNPYGTDNMQGNTDDAQRAALLDTQRMTVLGGGQGAQPAVGKGQRKAPAAANGQVRVAGQPGRPNPAANALAADGTAKTTYADPYTSGKRGVYRSPW
ncbi:hypothetical protein SAMN02787142_2581 [Burkholderia sp. WP9]|uniref:hypothetical protein n=1 Tax=Burkholderia sp. WP9 TaxID=1500263 RepID=UPI00089C46BC|nr:hypothetical protein [Burkholderia sp. WP9]SED11429.1 hypothetical protein SAMN02787142_2581 [Burkholderia sp. WP9]